MIIAIITIIVMIMIDILAIITINMIAIITINKIAIITIVDRNLKAFEDHLRTNMFLFASLQCNVYRVVLG